MTRAYLILVGLFFFAVGIAYLAAPVEMAALVHMNLQSATAVIDVQGFYGGQMSAVGVVILLALRLPWLTVPALVLIATTLGGTAAGRLFGFISGGEWPPLMIGLFVLEVASAAIAFGLLQRDRAAA